MRVFSKTPAHGSATAIDPNWDEETKKCFLLQASINKVYNVILLIYIIVKIILKSITCPRCVNGLGGCCDRR